MVANAPRPIAVKVIRQPKYWPIMRPIGIPNTIASAVPVAIRLSACARLPGGAMRMASADVIDQNTACAKAIPMRLITSTSKFQQKRQDVAGDKQNKQADKQAPALHFAGQQHKRQRH